MKVSDANRWIRSFVVHLLDDELSAVPRAEVEGRTADPAEVARLAERDRRTREARAGWRQACGGPFRCEARGAPGSRNDDGWRIVDSTKKIIEVHTSVGHGGVFAETTLTWNADEHHSECSLLYRTDMFEVTRDGKRLFVREIPCSARWVECGPVPVEPPWSPGGLEVEPVPQRAPPPEPGRKEPSAPPKSP